MSAQSPEPSPSLPVSAPSRHRGRWVVLVLGGLIAACLGVLVLVVVATGLWSRGFTPVGLAAAAPVLRDVVGDLGGMPVTMPGHVPHLVEYDGDPGWEPRPGWRPPQRTHASRLNSFGIHVRYPDMATLSAPELENDFRRKRMYEHRWLDLTIQSGKRYPGHGFLDRLYRASIAHPEQQRFDKQYEEVPSTLKGLQLYAKRGINPQTGRPHRYEWSDGDIFIGRDPYGHVTTHIRCTFRSGTDVYSGCQQSWSMESYGLSIEMLAYYAPVLLPQWQDIQTRTSQFVLGFKDPAVPPVPPSPR